MKKILYIFLVLLLVLGLYVQSRPAEFKISRSLVMNVSPEKVFTQVNNFHLWQEWSPWAKLDPQAKAEFSGPELSEQSSFAWDGNHQVGKGKMIIEESKPFTLIKIKLDFEKPFQATNYAEFTFVQNPSGTEVIWTMTGQNNFVGKAMSLVMDCDKMVGGMFEKGLSQLKAIVENSVRDKP